MVKRLSLSIVFFVMIFIALPAPSPAGSYKVIYVFDGDTIRVVDQGGEVKVRLVGIDSPETRKGEKKPGQPFSQKSKKYLMTLVLGKTVEITSYGRDDYNRILGVVYLDGVSINFEMIRSGLAEVYRAMPPLGLNIAVYKDAEEEARNAKRGMWIQGDKYVSPWRWRRMHRE